MDFDDDNFEYFDNSSIDNHQNENFDFPLHHSTPSFTRSKSQIRSIDYPSAQKHYGIVQFFDTKIPVIYRLLNDTHYIPYIRFSYVFFIFEHPTYKQYLVNIRNLPVVEMTSIERTYYNQLSPNNTDWSDNQLLSVSMLDGMLEVINCLRDLHVKNEILTNQWQDMLNKIRNETKNRWILEENIVLNRLKEINSTCLLTTTIAKRRSFFEQRLDLSIVDEAGGFLQIDSYIYPFIKNPLDQQIYINLDDIRQHFVSPLTDFISYVDQTSPMSRAYAIVMQQAQINCIEHGKKNNLVKYLPIARQSDEIPFLSLQILLRLFLTKNSHLNLQFVQLFENSSMNEIELNYKINVARQFIITSQRQGGLINNQIPCLIQMENDRQKIFIPTDIRTRRSMSNDERLYLNMILLYYGLWKNSLIRKKQWFLKEMNDNEKENVHIEILK